MAKGTAQPHKFGKGKRNAIQLDDLLPVDNVQGGGGKRILFGFVPEDGNDLVMRTADRNKHRHTSPFNMIEVMLSLALLVFVLVAIVGMCPTNIESNRQAISRIAASDTADQFLSFFSARLKQNWRETYVTPSSKYSDEDTGLIFSGRTLTSDSALKVNCEAPSEISAWDPEVTNSGVFKIRHTTDMNRTDFGAIARIWKNIVSHGEGGPESLMLFTEISRPGHVPWKQSKSMNLPTDSLPKYASLGMMAPNLRVLWHDSSGPRAKHISANSGRGYK